MKLSKVEVRRAVGFVIGCVLVAPGTEAQDPAPGRNVNMVSGAAFPGGDPFLQRQNEPSLAASTRNPMHLLAGANDYRTVDLPGLDDAEETGDAWLGVFKSFDGGQTWRSTLVPGFPQDGTPIGLGSPIKGFQAAADPVVRAGTNGLFYFSGLALNRGANAPSAVFVSRFIDNNNLENLAAGDPIQFLDTSVVDDRPVTNPRSKPDPTRPAQQFLDKPWLAVDIPRSGATCTVSTKQPDGTTLVQRLPAGPVYVAYTVFSGELPSGEFQRSDILFSRSLDCGRHWSTPRQLNVGTGLNQGASIAIDPASGDVFVAWRQFRSQQTVRGVVVQKPDAIYIAKSARGCGNFSAAGVAQLIHTHDPNKVVWRLLSKDGSDKPRMVSQISSFEQGTSEVSFRTNAYPSLAIDATSRLYLAWAERGEGPGGDSRIVVATSKNGSQWTTPVAVDNPPDRGHQFMPSLAFNAGRLLLVYYDQRLDNTVGVLEPQATGFVEERELAGDLAAGLPANVFNQFIADAGPPSFDPNLNPISRRHTIDVRAALAMPGDQPVFQSGRVTDSAFGEIESSTQIQQLQFLPPNLPMFSHGTESFLGDYIDVAGAPPFMPTSTGGWTYNTASDGTRFHTSWADNRDVRPPPDGDWTNYTPPAVFTTDPTSIFDPTQTRPPCEVGRAGMRNQNVYTARVTDGLFVDSPGNAKPLGLATAPDGSSFLIERGFVIEVQNTQSDASSYRLTIGNQPPGGQASFLQVAVSGFAFPLTTLDLSIPPLSTASRTVFVKSTDPHAQVGVQVQQIDAPGGALVSGGLAGSVLINPDPSNPTITNPDLANPHIANAEVYTPDIVNPHIANVDVSDPNLTTPDVANPDPASVTVVNPDIVNPHIANPDVVNPHIANLDIANPHIANPDLTNGSITDASWTFTNRGNTTAAYAVELQSNKDVPVGIKTQLILNKLYTTPVVEGCDLKLQTQNLLVANIPNPVFFERGDPQIANPHIANPDITNATVSLAPGETAEVTVRVVDPDRTDAITFDPASAVSPVAVAQAINTLDRLAGGTQPPELTSLTAVSTVVATGNLTSPYNFTIDTTGGVGPFTFTIVGGSLPPGTSLDSASGQITGTPAATGTFTFTVQITDSQGHVSIQTLTLTINPPGINGTSPTGPMVVGVTNSSVVTLADGRVLVISGADNTDDILSTTQIYDPTTGVFTTTGSLNVVHLGPAVLLADGRVLTAGGGDNTADVTTSEIYDPATGLWTLTGNRNAAISGATAVRLLDGRVLFAGGDDGVDVVTTAEVYDPATGTFSLTGSLNVGREVNGVLLPDGRVLLAGGFGPGFAPLASAEIYDPSTGVWTLTGSMATPRQRYAAAILPDGRILYAGGQTVSVSLGASAGAIAQAEIYDPVTGTFSPTGSMNIPRSRAGGYFVPLAPVLSNGKVLIAGGQNQSSGTALNSVELYDPVTGTFSLAGNMSTPHSGPVECLLPDGRGLIFGGRTAAGGFATITPDAEIFTP